MNVSTIFSALILLISLSCNSNNDNQYTKATNETGRHIPNNSSEEADYISRMNYRVYVKLDVTSISADSILVKITLVNDSDKVVTLYKPALPIGRPAGNTFLIQYTKSTLAQVPFIDTVNTFKYTKDTRPSNFFFRVIPEIFHENIIEVGPHQEINFSLNIARYYDFKNLGKENIKNFSIGYAVLMPVIEEKKHIYEVSHPAEAKKPVYAVIGSGIVGNGTIKKINFSIPK